MNNLISVYRKPQLQRLSLLNTYGQQLFFVENSEILIFAIFSQLEGGQEEEKGIHWLGQVFKICLKKNRRKLMEKKINIF